MVVLKTDFGDRSICLMWGRINEILNDKNSLYDSLDDFFQSALRKEIFLN